MAATDIPLRPAAAAAEEDTGETRPVPLPGGPAARVRRLIGIKEPVLAWVPEERARYTWYGVLVVNTALLGAVSLSLALSSFRSDLPVAAVAGAALMWFWVVLALDSWLVSSTHGTGVRKWTLAVRFFLSVLLGLFIAEPILFQIFDKEIRQEISVGNVQKVADYRDLLDSCNPADGTSTGARPECAGYRLKVKGSPGELDEPIRRNAAAAETLSSQVDSLTRTLGDKMATEQELCGPDHWIWRGGVRDVTITCERAREDSATFRATSGIDTYENQLKEVRAEGRRLSTEKTRAVAAYQPRLQEAIDTKTAERAADLDSDGILTKAHGLKEVAESDGFALFLTVVLHLLLLCLDAMPVLAKVLGGKTAYDTLLGARFTASRALYAKELQVQQACAQMEHDVRRHRVEQETNDRMRRVERAYQRAEAERAAQERAELEERMARILRLRRA